MRKLNAVLILIIFLASCWDFTKKPAPNPQKVIGYKPVYTSDSSILYAVAGAPQPVKYAGKIYVKGQLIFQNDIGYGIHVIDNSNPATASRVGFIRLPGNSEISIKGNYMYANSYSDLVVIDISDWQHVREVKRLRHAFSNGGGYNFIPLPEKNVYYECPDYYSGIQTGWVKDSVDTNNCYNP